MFSCYYICVIVSVLVYSSFGRIFNDAITRIISTLRIDIRTFDQENSDSRTVGFCFQIFFKEMVNYRIFFQTLNILEMNCDLLKLLLELSKLLFLKGIWFIKKYIVRKRIVYSWKILFNYFSKYKMIFEF